MTYIRECAGGGFEVRVIVPKDCRDQIGKANLTRRLGRVSRHEANRLAAPVISEFLALLDAVRTPNLTPLASGPPPPSLPKQLPDIKGQASFPSVQRITLTELFEAYIRERQPAAATVKRWRPVIASLSGHLGHENASRIKPEDIVGWKEVLTAQGVSGRTVREVYLAAAKVILTWAVENRKLPTNPASGISVRVKKRTRFRDLGFTNAEALTILQATVSGDFCNLTPAHARARRWIPWMCTYSGARVGEIAQLRGRDFVNIDGIWALRITPEAGSTKSGEARNVPLHEHLIEQGLLKIVSQVGDGPIFYDPRLGRGGTAGNPHHKKVGERLAAWVREVGVNDPNVQPNHGWRHLFKTMARRAGIEPEVRDAIQGHAPRSIGESYGDWPVDVLVRAINMIPRFPIPATREIM